MYILQAAQSATYSLGDLSQTATTSSRDTTRQEFMQAFPYAEEVGRAFPIFLIDKLEFSFPRGKTIDEDLESRDLTVNALLLDEDGCLLCHPKSIEDLHARVLRPASTQSFIDDPLRVFRAARFWASFQTLIPPGTNRNYANSCRSRSA